MNVTAPITQRERELGAIINAYNEVTDRLKVSHERLTVEVARLHTQLDEKNRELARRERLAALGEMAAGVAHEIRNPLAGIQLYASLLKKDLHDRPEQQELAARISGGVDVLDGIVNDVLAFAGEVNPHVGRVAVAGLLRECLASAEPARKRNDATVIVDEAADDLVVRGDAGQLQRALLNLLFNALDAAGEHGRVWISVATDASDSTAAIRIADDGPGIPEASRERVFNPFFTTKDSGTGLGLAIVHRIAEANGGSVSAGARPEGGAEMILRIPLWTDASEAAGAPGN